MNQILRAATEASCSTGTTIAAVIISVAFFAMVAAIAIAFIRG